MKATLYTYSTNTAGTLPGKLAARMVNDQGRRYWVIFSTWMRTYYRTTNKRTGAPLKKAVVDHITRNALLIDTQIDREETNGLYYDWQDSKKYYSYTFTGSRRDSTTEKMPRELDLTYTEENILLILKHITGRDYDGINIVHGEAVKPAEWETIQAREKAALQREMIGEEIEKLSEWAGKYLEAGKNIGALLLEKMRALESFTGTTAADVDRIKNLVKRSGGWYEKNIMSSSARLVLKESADCFKVYNLAQNTFFRVKNNIITA